MKGFEEINQLAKKCYSFVIMFMYELYQKSTLEYRRLIILMASPILPS